MGWYRVVKTIKGHRYLYAQRTWREGKKVRTESHYIGPVAPEEASTAAPTERPEPVNTTPDIFYHGAREILDGALEPSASGTFGPGFYLTTKERAVLYAQHDARIAAKIAAGEIGWEQDPPQHDGQVYAFGLSGLRIKEFTWGEYLDRCEALDEAGAATPSAKAKLQESLAAEGYDGLYVPDEERHELVVFPASVHKLSVISVDTTEEKN